MSEFILRITARGVAAGAKAPYQVSNFQILQTLFFHRRHLGIRRGTLGAHDGEGTQLPGLHVRVRRLHGGDRGVDVSAHHVGERACGCLVGHVHDVMPVSSLTSSIARCCGPPLPGDE